MCCVPGQDTLLSQCYSLCGKIDPCDGLASNSSNSNKVNVVVVVVVVVVKGQGTESTPRQGCAFLLFP